MRRLAFLCQGEVIQGNPEVPIRSISIDSRSLKKGDLFWAIEGIKFNGNDFVPQAAKAGALGAVASKDYPPKTFSPDFPLVRVRKGFLALGRFAEAHRLLFPALNVVAVTGSSGKTTVKAMTAAVLGAKHPVFFSPGNYNNEIGCPLAMLEINAKHRFGVFELAARKPGDIEYLSQLVHPNVSILTNIGPAHLETFGSLEKVWETKTEILRGMGADGAVIYNADDEWLSRLPKIGLPQRLLSFGFSDSADARGSIESERPEGTSLEVFYKGKKAGRLRLKLIGKGNALNALAAFACGMAVGIPADASIKALESFEPVEMRGRRVPLPAGIFDPRHVMIHDAYNANPASMADSVIAFLRAYKDRRRLVVLGAMHELGPQSGELHRLTAETILKAGKEDGFLDNQISFIIVGGGQAEIFAEAFKSGCAAAGCEVHYETRTDALNRIKHQLADRSSPCALMFKASRAEGLEGLIQEITEKL